MDWRRLKLLPLAWYKLRYLKHILMDRRDLAAARSYIWATLFSRDSGLALQDKIYSHFPALGPYPRQLEIEVTTACDLKCVICEHTYWSEKPRHMSFDQFRSVVDQFPGLRWIGLTGIGSGFLNPDYMKMLRYLKEERGCFVEFFDHFLKMDEQLARQMVEIGINKIWVSLESANAKTYNNIRVGSDFDTVISNVRSFMRIKRQMKSPIPELWFHFIINKYNKDEMEQYIDLVASLSDEEGGLSATVIYWTNLLAFDEVEDLQFRPTREHMDTIERKCRDRGIFSVFNENLLCDKPMNSCTKWNEPFVLVTGHVQPCCALNEANNRPYQERNAFLNLFEGDFRDWWRSGEKEAFVRNLQNGVLNPVCRNCHIFRHPQSSRPISIRDYERKMNGEGENKVCSNRSTGSQMGRTI